MLTKLSIKNYLLIDNIELNFNSGFSVITGETGAGKSIIIGAISLLLGKRADNDVIFDKNSKCIIEANFNLSKSNLEYLFKENDIDFDNNTIIRREIIPGGKSRSFINDTPVTLSILKTISDSLIDLHSQHENLALSVSEYRLKIVDTIASTVDKFQEYSKKYAQYINLQSELNQYKIKLEKARRDIDYYKFQSEQIQNAKLEDDNELEQLENQSSILENAEDIKEVIQQSLNILENNDISIESLLREVKVYLQKLSKKYKPAEEKVQRIDSILIELKDITESLSQELDSTEFNPELLQKINSRIDLINNLLLKHNVENITRLKNKYDEFSSYINNTNYIEERIEKLEKEIETLYLKLLEEAKNLSIERKKSIPKIENHITKLLKELGIEHAVFKVQNEILTNISASGIDNISFLFSANKSVTPQTLEKIASGGEFSRLMLALKSLVADSSEISTIIFDEIDTGVSGEIASRMGKIMNKAAENFQIISITHLPQVAALGKVQFKVFKDNSGDRSITKIKELTKDERIREIASMISGEKLTPQAIENAKTLLKSSK